jgi:hypothetical protein
MRELYMERQFRQRFPVGDESTLGQLVELLPPKKLVWYLKGGPEHDRNRAMEYFEKRRGRG